jgi:outer membrane lipoprotein SlyB
MLRFIFWVALVLALTLTGCGNGTRLLSIQLYPSSPALANNTIVYIAPNAFVQYQIQGAYSDGTARTIPSSQGSWSSSNTAIAAVSASGLATSAGPIGVTTISVVVSGHKSTSLLSVQ